MTAKEFTHGFEKQFEDIVDYRQAGKITYTMIEILFLAAVAVAGKAEEKTGDSLLSKAESLAKFLACVAVSPSSAGMAICGNEEYMKNLPVVTNVAEVLFKANVCHLLSPTPVIRVVCSSGFDLLEGKMVDANDVALNAFYALAGQLLIGAAYEYLL